MQDSSGFFVKKTCPFAVVKFPFFPWECTGQYGSIAVRVMGWNTFPENSANRKPIQPFSGSAVGTGVNPAGYQGIEKIVNQILRRKVIPWIPHFGDGRIRARCGLRLSLFPVLATRFWENAATCFQISAVLTLFLPSVAK